MGTLAVAGQKVPASFYNQFYGFADTGPTTVTAAVQTNLTTSYTIPASEPQVGSAYELLFGGSGTWGATQQILTFNAVIGGVTVINNITVGAQAFSASAGFRFEGTLRLVWNTVGATGNVLAGYLLNMSQTANNIAPPGTITQANLQAQASYGLADGNNAPSAAINTTAAVPVVMTCAWNATTGAPTITNRHTIFRKVA